MLNLCYLYYLSKLTEFADTMFFVLRKKSSQITWLHVYHHSVTPLETWVLVKFLAGELSRPAIINKLSPLMIPSHKWNICSKQALIRNIIELENKS